MTLTTRRQQPRAAFTLIELLVVMAIIAILVGLLMAAVQRVRVMGPQTENAGRIQQIGEAVGRCKSDLKLSYIPSQPFSGGGFTIKSAYASTDPELEILLRAFPNMSLTANGYTGANITLDANQTLCFFLTGGTITNYSGFSNNPTRPFTPKGAGTETRKGPWLENNPKLFDAAGHLIDVYGTPYAYFASVEGKQANYGSQTFGTLTPYTSAGKIMNEGSFQIVSAGRDKVFGTGGPLPAVGSPGGEDNQSNFSQYLLGGRLD